MKSISGKPNSGISTSSQDLGAAKYELVRAAASGVMLHTAGGLRQSCIWGPWERIWWGVMIARGFEVLPSENVFGGRNSIKEH
jgi:hypothetical protein